MKYSFRLTSLCFLAATIFLNGSSTALSAPTAKPQPRVAALETNSPPLSIFTIPSNDTEGRDPFFPKSKRSKSGKTEITDLPPKNPKIELIFNGVSGTTNRQLAIINGKTLAAGEEAEIVTSTGRVKIRCIEIKGETVVVEVFGERRELRLRYGK